MQLPVPNNPATNVPLAAGYLKAYAHTQGLLDHFKIDILPRSLVDNAGDALLVDTIVAHAPDVLGISLYTWNSERSLDIAQRVKAHLPRLIVVGGGPEIQPDNEWALRHPGLDIAVIGEGEQTFCELLLEIGDWRLEIRSPHLQSPISNLHPHRLSNIAGLAFRDHIGALIFTLERTALSDLSALPSPYLLGYLEPGPMLMVEVSRWCPYACSFCLYGRNMGPKLGNRYFPLEQILAEIRWGRERGATSVHFIEANLNLVPIFRPLMAALADLNADGALALYAELRGEHLSEETVVALARAGLRVAEVGLQTANPESLKAVLRRTDLVKWAAGTRRLYAHGVEVLLDVILGLPADDADGVAETLDFIQREDLGPYDVFTLQVLPGTAVRQQAEQFGMRYQDRPPYYVLQTNRLTYTALRQLRHDLKLGAGFDLDAVEGCPAPRIEVLTTADDGRRTNDERLTTDEGRTTNDERLTTDHRPPTIDHRLIADPRSLSPDFRPLSPAPRPLTQLLLVDADEDAWAEARESIRRLASHVDIVVDWRDVERLSTLLTVAIQANLATLFDVYAMADAPPRPDEVRQWREALPYQPGYLDRVAVYRLVTPQPEHERVSPRVFLVVPWIAQIEPTDYAGVAEIIWVYDLAPGEEPPRGAWRAAGGAGVWARGVGWVQVGDWRLGIGD
jgi:radical SAM superfamily enzyme YgiQ (UPF0313 family)